MFLPNRSCISATLRIYRNRVAPLNLCGFQQSEFQIISSLQNHVPTFRNLSTVALTTQQPSSSTGGVWAPTSAKRDKIAELTAELKWDRNQRSLNDVATLEQKMDLHLIEGLSALLEDSDTGNFDSNPEMQATLQQLQFFLQNHETTLPTLITKDEYLLHLQQLLTFVSGIKQTHFSIDFDHRINPLMYIRDFCIYDSKQNSLGLSSTDLATLTQGATQPFHQCQLYLQLTLLECCIKFFQSQWKQLLTRSNIEIDRLAHESSEKDLSNDWINVKKLHRVLISHFNGSCSDRVKALWDLKDGNNDQRIEKDDLEPLITWSMRPMHDAFSSLVEDSLKACPLRLNSQRNPVLLQEMKAEQGYFGHNLWYYLSSFSHYLTMEEDNIKQKVSAPISTGLWTKYKDYQNRKDRHRVEKNMVKYLAKTIRNHFNIEVETPHRLRCIYAWADKQHQQGKIETIFVQDGIMNSSSLSSLFKGSRKRYVELEPQISYDEFRSMQSIHFPHLDRMGSELCTSLKEELWIHEGKRRQGVEWRREAMIFLTAVTVLDVLITIS